MMPEVNAVLKKLLLSSQLALCVAGCASHPATPATATPKVAATAEGPPAGCVADTATRIPASSGTCAAFGHTWTQTDIKSTGASDTGQALRNLDPTLTIKGQ